MGVFPSAVGTSSSSLLTGLRVLTITRETVRQLSLSVQGVATAAMCLCDHTRLVENKKNDEE